MSTTSYSRTHRIVAYGFIGCVSLMVVAGMLSTGARSDGSSGPGTPTPTAAPSTTAPAQLTASPPSRLRIPHLGVDVRVVRLGAAAGSRTLALPPLRATGWDATSVAPGQNGVTVVAGFIERSVGEPGALANLSRLHRGDAITVRRRDGASVRYRVTRIAFYPQGHLPADKVFAPADRPELRLVSLGGPLHPGDPIGNAVVFATLAG